MEAAIKEFLSKLQKLYKKQLFKVILFGSHARDTATEESDIDLLVVLKGDIQPGLEIDRMIETIDEIDLKYDTLLAVIPISKENFEQQKSPLLLNVRKEGVVIG